MAGVSSSPARLRYVNDEEPGISRRPAGKGFSYRCADGRTAGRADLERIRGLAIPPAWTDVWICADALGHIQATGRDQRGRKQYRYHPRWTERRDEAKFSRLGDFARTLPRLRRKVNADLGKRKLSREKVVAAIVWLLDNTMIRVGSPQYARENGSFGLTTLRGRHVDVSGSTLRFAFKGKSGKQWRLQLVDRRMAGLVRRIQELPGQHLFQYIDDNGERSRVTSDDVNDYIRAACGPDFSSKDFRTWGGTVRALALFGDLELPDGLPARQRLCNQVIDEVASRLGNTRTVCRKGYIHPAILERWSDGELWTRLHGSRRTRSTWLDVDEARTLAWLSAF
ncbi:DNA topoisomerase type I [Aminobacter sp. MSH1]|uniref:DNA topoisomerase IB n=1 Tax=Aminobacter sp. MSH1 TaxID=374606 RepID=UPI000D50486D|nr:DNA topoisomerase IB [Aminobacter sp. MSH1]AWC25154.1 DNA topoisomerase type I [Aminobacter sp. MSH1]